jgi:hypothetical protein
MAKIIGFQATALNSRAHPTEVICGHQVINSGDDRLLQLSTFGSAERRSEYKVSQTLQIDQRRATELIQILAAAFPELPKDRVDASTPLGLRLLPGTTERMVP